MNGSASTSTWGGGGVADLLMRALLGLQIISEFHLAPVLGPGAVEVMRVVAGFAGGVDPHLAYRAPGMLAFQRSGRRVVGRAARVFDNDHIAGRIAARGDGVVDLAWLIEIGVGADR